MKKKLKGFNEDSLSLFEKKEFNQLSTIQGGDADMSTTDGSYTRSSASDPDTNSDDTDAPTPPIIIIIT